MTLAPGHSKRTIMRHEEGCRYFAPAAEEPGPQRSKAADGDKQSNVELAAPPGQRVGHVCLRHAVAWC